MTCKWLNKVGEWISRRGTVEVEILKPDGTTLETRTPYKLEELINNLQGTGCKVVKYGKYNVEQTEE